MAPEQILNINEQMAKVCGYTPTLMGKDIWITIKEDDCDCAKRFNPHKDWNHLMEVYNACLKLRVQLDKNEAWVNTECTTQELKALAALRSFLLSNEHYYAVITDSYTKLSEFINWYNKLLDE